MVVFALLLLPAAGCTSAEAERRQAEARSARTDEAAPTTQPAAAFGSGFEPSMGAIQPDILLVNGAVLTIPEALYPIREKIKEARTDQTARGFNERLLSLVRTQVQQEVGSMLVYEEAERTLSDGQKAALDEFTRRRVEERVGSEFGGSTARLTAHLKDHGLTLEQFKNRVKRELLVSQYTREKMLNQVRLTREDLQAAYRENAARYTTESTRELLVIEIPFAKMLPEGLTWDSATEAERSAARSAAEARMRAAEQALAARPFAEVAAEFSRGVGASAGGSWGKIGRPLQPPYDVVSAPIFTMSSGQRSQPIETAAAWYLVQCGEVEAARTRSFAEVQDELREELLERRYTQDANAYIQKLLAKATILGFDGFVASAVRQAAGGTLAAR